jgi:alpha-amylase
MGWKDIPAVPAEAPKTVAEVSLDIPAGAHYTPSPKNWLQEIFYSVILDRFARAKPYRTWGDTAAANTRHGGNIRGLIDRLPYLLELGVTTILINPLYLNPPAAYHGYAPAHFMAVDPSLGTMADFKELVAKGHMLGMRFILDTVTNHTGPVIEYEDGWKFSDVVKKIKRWVYPVGPAELRDENNFHRRGSIEDWNNPDQIRNGDYPGGLNQLATERPETQDILIKIVKWWLKETDVDGFRLDAYLHVSPSLWPRLFQEVREFAAKLGKDNFLLLGEVLHGDPAVVKPELASGLLDAAYNYPSYFWDEEALHGDAPTSVLERSFNDLRAAFGDLVQRLVRFLDNHDMPRFLRGKDPAGVLRVALAYTMFSMGIPYFLYGTEQALSQFEADYGADGSREDMFPEGRFRNAGGQADYFNTESPMYRHMAALAALRKAHPALSLGEQYIRWSDPHGPGIFAFSRIHEGEEVLVVLNTAGEERSAQMPVDGSVSPPGTELADALEPGYAIAAVSRTEGGSQVTVAIPPHGVRVLVRRVHSD